MLPEYGFPVFLFPRHSLKCTFNLSCTLLPVCPLHFILLAGIGFTLFTHDLVNTSTCSAVYPKLFGAYHVCVTVAFSFAERVASLQNKLQFGSRSFLDFGFYFVSLNCDLNFSLQFRVFGSFYKHHCFVFPSFSTPFFPLLLLPQSQLHSPHKVVKMLYDFRPFLFGAAVS